MDKLKPCKFCGSPAELCGEDYIAFEEESYVIVMCCSCGIRTPRFYYGTQEERTIAETIVSKLWNRKCSDA